MMNRNGFAPLIIILLVAVAISASVGVAFYFFQKPATPSVSPVSTATNGSSTTPNEYSDRILASTLITVPINFSFTIPKYPDATFRIKSVTKAIGGGTGDLISKWCAPNGIKTATIFVRHGSLSSAPPGACFYVTDKVNDSNSDLAVLVVDLEIVNNSPDRDLRGTFLKAAYHIMVGGENQTRNAPPYPWSSYGANAMSSNTNGLHLIAFQIPADQDKIEVSYGDMRNTFVGILKDTVVGTVKINFASKSFSQNTTAVMPSAVIAGRFDDKNISFTYPSNWAIPAISTAGGLEEPKTSSPGGDKNFTIIGLQRSYLPQLQSSIADMLGGEPNQNNTIDPTKDPYGYLKSIEPSPILSEKNISVDAISGQAYMTTAREVIVLGTTNNVYIMVMVPDENDPDIAQILASVKIKAR